MISFITPIILALMLSSPCFGKEPFRTVEGIVSKVADGDTIAVIADGTKLKVRLYGIDAPETEKSNRRTGRLSEPGQPYGEEALQALQGKVMNKPVRLDIMDIYRYKRMVSVVWLYKSNINREMVAEGWAWAYRQYLGRPHASEYIIAEEQARRERRGLWKESNPQPPWEFRKELRVR